MYTCVRVTESLWEDPIGGNGGGPLSRVKASRTDGAWQGPQGWKGKYEIRKPKGGP